MKSSLPIAKRAFIFPLCALALLSFTSCGTRSSLQTADDYEELTAIAKETMEREGLLIKDMDTTAYLIRGEENNCILFTFNPENIINDSVRDPIVCYNKKTFEEFML